jgi:hypothetical protein
VEVVGIPAASVTTVGRGVSQGGNGWDSAAIDDEFYAFFCPKFVSSEREEVLGSPVLSSTDKCWIARLTKATEF